MQSQTSELFWMIILAQRCSKALIWFVCCMIRPHNMTCIFFQKLVRQQILDSLQVYARRTMLLLDELMNMPWMRQDVFHPPDLPQWIVVLSPVPMHFDAELGELLKIFGVQQMDRVSFEGINVPVWSIETAMDLVSLRSYGLQLTLLEAGPVTGSGPRTDLVQPGPTFPEQVEARA